MIKISVLTLKNEIIDNVVLMSFIFLAGKWGVYAHTTTGSNYCIAEYDNEDDAIKKSLSFSCDGIPTIIENGNYSYNLARSLKQNENNLQ